MGYAQGQILREELIDFITGVWTHLGKFKLNRNSKSSLKQYIALELHRSLIRLFAYFSLTFTNE